MVNTKISIIIADDHRIFLEGLKRLIQNDSLKLVGTASNGAELMALLAKEQADVVILDLNLPDESGIQLTRKIVRKYPKAKVLGLTMVEDGKQIAAMMKAGASGYVLKSSSSAELLDAIYRVYKGERYLSSEASLRLLESKQNEKKEKAVADVPLTRREQEVLRLIAKEMTCAEIARALNNSPMTIITHRKNILRKLGVKNTAGLIRYAYKFGLAD
ncbi:MAG: response regulator transcription factor [Chitinophagales bacterium]|nr:response regulator transcription factor [Chitinophagales bacterium]MDW8428494.1 response regulator transcription factor [Chitinophagales bacterium]